MKHLKTFESFLNEAASTYIEDSGTLKTKLGNLKYEVKGGLDRGGNNGNYQIDEKLLSDLIGSIDMNAISKILGEQGIDLDTRPSEFTLNLTNTGLGHNGLSVIRPEISFPITLPKEWPEKVNGWVTSKEEYEIYSKMNAELERINNKSYWVSFADERNPRYGSSIDPKNPRIVVTFQDGSLGKN
jgi:hypothetical protein